MNRMLMSMTCMVAVVAGSGTAEAQVNTYLLVVGVPGESTDALHAGWIDLQRFSQTLEPSKKDIGSCQSYAVKRLDAASPALWSAAASGTVFLEMQVDIVRAGGEQQKFFEQKMTNVRVGRVTFAEIDGLPSETVLLLPQTVTIRYATVKADGSLGPAIVSTVNCLQ